MGLSKVHIGDLITLNNTKNIENRELPFYGINKDKEFMPTIAATENLDGKKYKILKKGMFVFSGMQTGRDVCIRIGLYNYDFDALVSPAYTTFDVTSDKILPEYLFMIFKSNEMDRYGAFLSDGSIRSNLDWNVFCAIELLLPDIDIQKKYVNIYLGMQENLDSMTRGIEEMKKTCDAYLESLLNTVEQEPISKYIFQYDERNNDLEYNGKCVRGISTQKEFISTKANMNGVSLSNYKVVPPNTFTYVADTSRRGDKISLAYNDTEDTYLVSSISTIFIVQESKQKEFLPKYLFMFLRRPEFDRYSRYNSWGSARETITWEDFGRLEIPVPKMAIQQDIVNIFEAYQTRQQVVNRLAQLQISICPILIRGAMEEGGR